MQQVVAAYTSFSLFLHHCCWVFCMILIMMMILVLDILVLHYTYALSYRRKALSNKSLYNLYSPCSSAGSTYIIFYIMERYCIDCSSQENSRFLQIKRSRLMRNTLVRGTDWICSRGMTRTLFFYHLTFQKSPHQELKS